MRSSGSLWTNSFAWIQHSLRRAFQDLRAKDLLAMAIVATAGTTDFGSIDPLSEVAAIATCEGAWLHVDAAYGGALLFSAQHRHKLASVGSCRFALHRLP